jgi:hypothetical protein
VVVRLRVVEAGLLAVVDVVVFFAAVCGLASFRGVAEGDLPLVPIDWISIWVSRLRWPLRRR